MGFDSQELPKELPFGIYAKGKISYNPNHPEFRAFEYLKSVTPSEITPKVIVAAPNFLLVFRDWKTDKFPSFVYKFIYLLFIIFILFIIISIKR